MFSDTSLTSPAIYSDSQSRPENSFARGYSPVNEPADHKKQWFSSINISDPFSFGIDTPFAIDPFNPLHLELTNTSSPSSNQFEYNGFDSPFVCDNSTAGNDAYISALCTPEGSGLDLPIELCRFIEDVGLPVSESSSGLSTPELETSLNYRFLEMETASPTSSSIPANRSSRQMRNGTPSTSTMAVEQASTEKATASEAADGRTLCSYEGCTETYYDPSTMRRHVIGSHLKIRPTCPGCGRDFSREDSLKRHLDNKVTYMACRVAAIENGWKEVEKRGKKKLSKPSWTNRCDLIAAHQSP